MKEITVNESALKVGKQILAYKQYTLICSLIDKAFLNGNLNQVMRGKVYNFLRG